MERGQHCRVTLFGSSASPALGSGALRPSDRSGVALSEARSRMRLLVYGSGIPPPILRSDEMAHRRDDPDYYGSGICSAKPQTNSREPATTLRLYGIFSKRGISSAARLVLSLLAPSCGKTGSNVEGPARVSRTLEVACLTTESYWSFQYLSRLKFA